jgi:hypothetical protein
MIRLKSLLFEDKPAPETARVLLVGDQFSKPKYSFMNRLFRLQTIAGAKFIEPGADSESMMNTVRNEINNGYNAVVVFCSGRNENKTLLNIIENFRLIIRFAQKADVKCILCTIPSFDYIDNKKDQVDEKFEKKINTINNWLTTNADADDIIDINFLTDKREYFSKSGNDLNQEANSKLFKAAISVLSDTIPSRSTDSEDSAAETVTVAGKKYDIDDIQQKLNKRGIVATKDEIRAGKVDDKIEALKVAPVVAPVVVDTTKVTVGTEQRGTAKTIIDYLKSKGLSDAGAAGVAANLYVESAGTFSTTIKGDHGTSIGLAQWHNDRWTGKNGLIQYSKQNGKDPYSIEGQLDFLLWELSKPTYNSLYKTLKTTEDPEEAADMFCKKFERPTANQATYDKRKKYAREFFDTTAPEDETDEKDEKDADYSWSSLTNMMSGILGTGTVAAAASSLFGLPQGNVDSGKVTPGGTNGDWGGSMYKALEVANVANEFVGKNIVSSQKRSRQSTASGAVSDHWSGSPDTYAVDLATSGAAGDALLAHIMQWLGHPEYTGGKWFNFNKNGYRYQIGWRVKDHYDHIHVGVKKI